MLDHDAAKSLARYKTWADNLTLSAVAGLPPGEAARERQTLFKSIIGTLNHSYIVDLIWQAHLEGREHSFSARNVTLYPDVAAFTEAQRNANEWLSAWAAEQTDQSLRTAVTLRLVSGDEGTMTRGEILLHIVNHATYRRGWVSDLFFQIPAKPPTTDWNVLLSAAR